MLNYIVVIDHSKVHSEIFFENLMPVIVENSELSEQHRLTKVIFFPFLFFYFDLWCHAFYFLFVIQSIYESDNRDILQHKGHKIV